MARATNLAVLPLLIGMLHGCAGSPPVHYYTLSPEAAIGSAGSATAGTKLRVAVGSISIPEVVDRPQLVLRAGATQVTLVDEHRWAGSLDIDIARVVAENLSRLLGTRQVWAYPQNAGVPIDYRVQVDIQRFESTPGHMAAIDALWTVERANKDGAEPKTGSSTVQQPIAGQGYDALVSAHSLALAAISREIAEAIRSFPPSSP